jgi:glycosyltransferase involved in cell wall biosynthesis
VSNAASVDCSIVIPVYYNEGSLSKTMASLKAEVIDPNSDLTCEVIFVDDGSRDGSLAELLRLHDEHPGLVKVIKFTRNFGQVAALMAGCGMAKGRCVVLMSADGQDPAGLIVDMLKVRLEESVDIVVCSRQGRDESQYRIWTSKLFYWLMRRLSFPNMPGGGFDFVLLSRRVVEVILRNQEAHPFLQGQILWTGFTTKFIDYVRREREIGASRWTLKRKITYLIDGVVGYSFVPIRLTALGGAVVAFIGFAYACVILVAKIAWGNPVPGGALTPILILILGGCQLLMLGIMGEYVWRILAQARHRDPYIIDAIYDRGGT